MGVQANDLSNERTERVSQYQATGRRRHFALWLQKDPWRHLAAVEPRSRDAFALRGRRSTIAALLAERAMIVNDRLVSSNSKHSILNSDSTDSSASQSLSISKKRIATKIPATPRCTTQEKQPICRQRTEAYHGPRPKSLSVPLNSPKVCEEGHKDSKTPLKHSTCPEITSTDLIGRAGVSHAAASSRSRAWAVRSCRLGS